MKFNLSVAPATASIKKLPRLLASHAFLVILVLILLAMVWGMYLLYVYGVMPTAGPLQNVTGAMKFEYRLYDKIITEWEAREAMAPKITGADYANPFSK